KLSQEGSFANENPARVWQSKGRISRAGLREPTSGAPVGKHLRRARCSSRDVRRSLGITPRAGVGCVLDHSRALPQGDGRAGPAFTRGAISSECNLIVLDTRDVLDDAVAGVVPDVHAEDELRLGFHGQVRLDSSWPAAIYTPCCCVV